MGSKQRWKLFAQNLITPSGENKKNKTMEYEEIVSLVKETIRNRNSITFRKQAEMLLILAENIEIVCNSIASKNSQLENFKPLTDVFTSKEELKKEIFTLCFHKFFLKYKYSELKNISPKDVF